MEKSERRRACTREIKVREKGTGKYIDTLKYRERLKVNKVDKGRSEGKT